MQKTFEKMVLGGKKRETGGGDKEGVRGEGDGGDVIELDTATMQAI